MKQEKDNKKKNTEKAPENKIKGFFSKIGTILRKKWLINGSKTILLIAIIICVYIGVNVLLEKVVLPEIDCTENKIYSLSDETKDKVGKLENEITITLINYSNATSITNFMDRYKELNNNIKIEKVDNLSVRSDLMSEYSLGANDSLIIVASGNNEKTLSENDFYTYDYMTYEAVDKTEEAITNAIVEVVTEKKPKVYFMSNHLMYDTQYYSTIMEAIKNEANEVETLDILAKGGIPEDCSCLVLATLKEDITEQEKDAIIKYIKNGGKLLLMCGPNIQNVNLSNFQKILDEYGVSIGNGVIFEGDVNKMLSGYPDFIIEDLTSTDLTKNMNMSMKACLVDAGKITFNEENLEKLGVEYESIIATSEKSYVRTDLTEQSPTRTSKDGKEESSTVAAIAKKQVEDNKTSKLIIFSNELFAMDMPVQINGYQMYTVSLYNNQDIILNSIAYLNDREDTITIRKDSANVSYTLTEQQHTIVTTIIFVLPILVVIAGIIVWQVRRRK